MNNLIKNANWQELTPEGGLKYFAGPNETLDDFSIDGNISCSVTLLATNPFNSFAANYYTLPIKVEGEDYINWGYYIRKIEAKNIELVAMFYDRNNQAIKMSKKNIADNVTHEFEEVSYRFRIPRGAYYVKLGLEFKGRVIACTYYEPKAYFS